MEIYKTRKQAETVRANDPWHSNDEKIVKVDGGYTLMTENEYNVWKKQK